MTTIMQFKVGQIWVFWVDDIRIEELITKIDNKKVYTKIITIPFDCMMGNTQHYTHPVFKNTIKKYRGGLKPTFNDYLCKI